MEMGIRLLALGTTTLFFAISATARDLNGRYANSPLKVWFDQLSSGKGRCCSIADGNSVADPDWESKNGHYRVRLKGEWIDVPDDAVIREPNRAGQTIVWPLDELDGLGIRCFLPGNMS
jgi:hypothetical protein